MACTLLVGRCRWHALPLLLLRRQGQRRAARKHTARHDRRQRRRLHQLQLPKANAAARHLGRLLHAAPAAAAARRL